MQQFELSLSCQNMYCIQYTFRLISNYIFNAIYISLFSLSGLILYQSLPTCLYYILNLNGNFNLKRLLIIFVSKHAELFYFLRQLTFKIDVERKKEIERVFSHASVYFAYLLTINILFQGGKDLVAMLNSFGSTTPLLLVVFVEAVGVCWFYGVSR